MLEFAIIIPVALVAAACSLLQSLVGFGFALFAVPLFIVCGLSLPQAVAVCLAASVLQGGVIMLRLRQHIQWRAIALVIITFILATPLGLAAMRYLVDQGPERMKQGIGIALLAALVLHALLKVKPREQVGVGWGLAAGVGGGFLTGSVGMGGPPFVLWVLAHRWTSEQIRASLLTIYAVGAPLQLAMLWWETPQRAEVNAAGLLGLLLTPLIIAGSSTGLRLATRLPVNHLRRIMLALLAAMAAYAIVSPYIR